MQRLLQLAADKVWRPFADLARAPWAMWLVIVAFALDCLAYFGMLTLMTSFLGRDLHWSDVQASRAVSLFTMLVTLAMLGIGSSAETFGLRRGVLAALALAVVGRAVFTLASDTAVPCVATATVIAGLLVMAVSSGILQPLCYSGVKQFTDEKTSSMGYAVIYSLMNLAIVVVGAVSAWVRPAVQAILDQPGDAAGEHGLLAALARRSTSGVQAVFWVCLGASLLNLLLMLALFTRRAEASRLRPESGGGEGGETRRSWGRRLAAYFSEGPFGNARFVFFIFMLLPVQTLFAHQWLTMPEYILRAYPKMVADRMEWLVNWINPGIIFVGVPLLTALTRRVDVYTMMVLGTLVSAAPTFLLCFGPDLNLLVAYLVLFSIGEALWSARFLEYASELAPPGRVAQYMGLANVPWLLAKGTTGFYSGYLLATYCAPKTPPAELRTGTLWLIYGVIAMTSPVGLWLGRRWVRKGLHRAGSQAAGSEAAVS